MTGNLFIGLAASAAALLAVSAADGRAGFSVHAVALESTDAQSRSPEPGDLRLPGTDGRTYWLRPEAIVAGDEIARAWLDHDRQTGEPAVWVQLDPQGTHRLAAYTAGHANGQLAVVLDGRVIEAPHVIAPIDKGTLQLVEYPPMTEAGALAMVDRLMHPHPAAAQTPA